MEILFVVYIVVNRLCELNFDMDIYILLIDVKVYILIGQQVMVLIYYCGLVFVELENMDVMV